MTREEHCRKIMEAIDHLDFTGTYLDHVSYGSGHINDTFLVRFTEKDRTLHRYILQRMNHEIFKNPQQLMENIYGVTKFLKDKIVKDQGDVNRETLNIIMTKGGQTFYQDSIGSYWRGYQFIEDAVSYDMVQNPDVFYQSAIAFGKFQYQLSDYPAHTLHETIPDFHNTPLRFEKFKKAIAQDRLGRVKEVKEEIQFVLDREEFTHILMNSYAEGKLLQRVTHNDTKLNNIMIDSKTKTGLCVIDLDTVMPGFSVNDFGDSIRFGASTGAEDEPDLSKVNFSIQLFELYTEGFLKGCRGCLTDTEIEMLPVGAKMMTLECGMRFLTDYLEGDTYFKIHRENHNLDRCRTQFKLVADMEKKWETMKLIVKNLSQEANSIKNQ
jgi:hypothetical protein